MPIFSFRDTTWLVTTNIDSDDSEKKHNYFVVNFLNVTVIDYCSTLTMPKKHACSNSDNNANNFGNVIHLNTTLASTISYHDNDE